MASSGPSAVVQERLESDGSGSAAYVTDEGMASAGGGSGTPHRQEVAAAASSITDSPKPSTSMLASASKDIVYDLVSVEQSNDSPAKHSVSEDSSMRECVSADSLLADLGITNMDCLMRGDSDSTDMPLISLSPYKVAAGMDLCDSSSKCSSSDNNVRDLESLLKEAGIEEIKDEVVVVSKTSSGLDMIEVLDEDQMVEDTSDGKVLTIKADIECVPPNSALITDTPKDSPQHRSDSSDVHAETSLSSPKSKDNSIAQNIPSPNDNHKKSNGIGKKEVKQLPKGKNKPKLQKQLKFSDEDDDSENYKNLKILPRTSQYEKHPLLQTKTESGLTTIEALLLEHEEQKKTERLKKHKSLSIEDEKLNKKRHNLETYRRKSVESSQLQFVPRTAQYERHPLLEKTESGLSELEQYLKEKEEEIMRQELVKRHSAGSIQEPRDKPVRKVSFPNVPEKRPSLGALMPRTAQYEKHPLLQSRDEETGMSEIEKFLHEKHMESMQEDEDEKVVANDTSKTTDEKSALLTEDAARDNKDVQQRAASIKRVHFEKSGKGGSEEIEELGSVQINTPERSSVSLDKNSSSDPKRKNNKDHDIKDSNRCCTIL